MSKLFTFLAACFVFSAISPAFAGEKDCDSFYSDCKKKKGDYIWDNPTPKEDKVRMNNPSDGPEPIDPWRKKGQKNRSLGEIQSDQLKQN